MRNGLTGAALEGRKAFSYTAVFWFKLAMASARSTRRAIRAAPLFLAAAFSPRKATGAGGEGDTLAAQRDPFACKATAWPCKATLSRPKVTGFGIFGQDSVRCVNTHLPWPDRMGLQMQG